jgi:hypothetical protein
MRNGNWSAGRVLALALVCGPALATGCGDDSGDEPSAGSGGTPPPVSGTGAGTGSGMGGESGSSGTPAPGMDAGATMCGSATCATGERCVAGACRRPCTGDMQCSGASCCGGYCTNTQSDRDHCGACDQACATGLSCAAGECAMPMCSGDPGDPIPVDPDWDAGVADMDAGAEEDMAPPVFGANGCPPNEVCSDEGDGPVCLCGTDPGCPPDERCEDGDCLCGDGPGCETAQTCCDASCVDLASDEGNCGLCGHACREGHTCTGGACSCPTAGERLCDGECVDMQTDEDNCGRCGRACADGASCVAGRCECDQAGEIACDGVCIDGETEQNCGACGNACEAPATCRDPSGSRPLDCYCPNVNEVPCDGVCVALGTTQNCGACGDSCDAPADVCRNRSCQCPTAGQTACGDSCVNLDTGSDSDPTADTLYDNCGACGITCLPNAACNAGVCSCPSASTTDLYCDEDPITGATDEMYACIEVTTTKNCGACGNACIDDSECRQSGGGDAPDDFDCVCIGSDSGKTHCTGAGCRTLNTDEEHCGACGNACPEDVLCQAGECNCPGPASAEACLVDDEPTCVDTASDEAHCGECGNACDAGEECCGGDCVDPDSYDDDRDNCGRCGTQCADIGCGFFFLQACDCNNGVCEG